MAQNHGAAQQKQTRAQQANQLADRQWLAAEQGAIGYIFLWLLGVPAGLLFLVFLFRGCN